MCIWQVRCLEDYGEFETEDGTVVLLKKNSQVTVHKLKKIRHLNKLCASTQPNVIMVKLKKKCHLKVMELKDGIVCQV